MAWISTDPTRPELGPLHATPAAVTLLRAGVGVPFRILDSSGTQLAAGLWLNTPDCEPAEHPHRQPLELLPDHLAATIEHETRPGHWTRL